MIYYNTNIDVRKNDWVKIIKHDRWPFEPNEGIGTVVQIYAIESARYGVYIKNRDGYWHVIGCFEFIRRGRQVWHGRTKKAIKL